MNFLYISNIFSLILIYEYQNFQIGRYRYTALPLRFSKSFLIYRKIEKNRFSVYRHTGFKIRLHTLINTYYSATLLSIKFPLITFLLF